MQVVGLALTYKAVAAVAAALLAPTAHQVLRATEAAERLTQFSDYRWPAVAVAAHRRSARKLPALVKPVAAMAAAQAGHLAERQPQTLDQAVVAVAMLALEAQVVPVAQAL